jgi:hypothetical protein
MQDRTVERLVRYSETKSGGGISTMASMTVDMGFVLVTTQIGNHRGDDRARCFSLWKMGNLPLSVPSSRVINGYRLHYISYGLQWMLHADAMASTSC